jgi:Protein of unknown function (DUF3800)
MTEDQGFGFLQIERSNWLVVISAFFDESGKFRDHSMVSLSGVAGLSEDFSAFNDDWRRELYRAGLKTLTMKETLRVDLPLSKKRPAKGIKNRIDDLLPFVKCIRTHLKLVICMAVDVEAFKALPSDAQRDLGNNPHYVAFTRILLEILEPIKKEDALSIICDDEEETALPMYKLYRKVKLAWKDAKERLAALCFADDQVFVQLQAADMVASLTRLDARQKLRGDANPFGPLFEAFSKPEESDKLWGFNTVIAGKDTLVSIARDLKAVRQKYGQDVNLLDLR